MFLQSKIYLSEKHEQKYGLLFTDIESVENKGRFIKPCPGTPNHICCGYKIINFAQGCNLGCSYCILDHYFSKSPLRVFNNRDKLLYELENYINKTKNLTRFGTGEFTDSLLFEDVFPIYHELIPYFSKIKNAILEIKTKTINIESLLKIKDRKNTIVSWSMNSEYISKREEKFAPSMNERIIAAYNVQESGYKLAFHFDPIIIYDGWELGYRNTIDLIFTKINPANVVYISMGTLRFLPEMKVFMDKQKTCYSTGEFIRGIDDKMRYFRPLRTGVYRRIKGYLQEYVEEERIYLCMETPVVWEDVFSVVEITSKKLKERLDIACRTKFPL